MEVVDSDERVAKLEARLNELENNEQETNQKKKHLSELDIEITTLEQQLSILKQTN